MIIALSYYIDREHRHNRLETQQLIHIILMFLRIVLDCPINKGFYTINYFQSKLLRSLFITSLVIHLHTPSVQKLHEHAF